MADIIQGFAAWKAYLVFAWLALFFALERLRPAAREGALRQGRTQPVAGGFARLGRNGGLWLCNVGLSLGVVLPVSAWAAANPLFARPELLTGWTGLVFDILLLDFLIYWWHRANHELGFLWRFHEVHHLDRFLDTTSALRFHFGEVLLSALARALVIVVFAVPFATVVVFEVLILLAAIFHHSNLRLPRRIEAGLGRVFITPAIHWVHHHARRRDTDSNYGTIFSFWDPLFGSRSPTARDLEMEIGVEGRSEGPLLGLLARPFSPRGKGAASQIEK